MPVGAVEFSGLRLDARRRILERDGQVVPIRAKSFALLCYLVERAGEVVSKEDILETVWKGIHVSDDALVQTIRDVRRTIGDLQGEMLTTIPKRGYLFAADAISDRQAQPVDDRPAQPATDRLALLMRESVSALPIDPAKEAGQMPVLPAGSPRPSGRARPAIAVLPFQVLPIGSPALVLQRDGLLRDIVRDLARLRTIFVISANSAGMLSGEGMDAIEAGRLLRVDYVCSGTLTFDQQWLRLEIELVSLHDDRLLLSETITRPVTEITRLGADLAQEAARLLSGEIDLVERNIAAVGAVRDLDAWQSYYRGLWHMHRFTADDNRMAAQFFRHSIGLDPTFARPYSGLSYTHWLNAWMLHPDEQTNEASLAYDIAMRGVAIDPNDPSAHCALGRALWIRGAVDEGMAVLSRSTELSANYAFGHYSRGFLEALSGDPGKGIEGADHARSLSPFDPFLPPMLSSKSVSLLRLGRYDESAAWAARAVAQPNAHWHIKRLAVISMEAAGWFEQARALAVTINAHSAHNGGETFLRAMRFRHGEQSMIRDLMRASGLA